MAKLKTNLTAIAQMAPEHAQEAMLATARDIIEIAKQIVPVETGSLRASGGAVPIDSGTVQVGFGAPGEYFTASYETKPRQPEKYAAYVEFGTENMAAQPYLTPAFLQCEETFKARLLQIMKKAAG